MCRAANVTTRTRCLRPSGRLISTSSPARIRRFGFAGCPFTFTLPPRHAFCASERVRKRQATSSHTSSRTSSTSSSTSSLSLTIPHRHSTVRGELSLVLSVFRRTRHGLPEGEHYEQRKLGLADPWRSYARQT